MTDNTDGGTSSGDRLSVAEIVGRNVAEARKVRGWSQTELADAMIERGHKFHQQTVLKVEKGVRRLQFDEAADVAQILGVTVSSLLWEPVHFDAAAALERDIGLFGEAADRVAAGAREMLKVRDMIAMRAMQIERSGQDIGLGDALAALNTLPTHIAESVQNQHDRDDRELQAEVVDTFGAAGRPPTFYGKGADDDG